MSKERYYKIRKLEWVHESGSWLCGTVFGVMRITRTPKSFLLVAEFGEHDRVEKRFEPSDLDAWQALSEAQEFAEEYYRHRLQPTLEIVSHD